MMKKILFISLMLIAGITTTFAQAQIKFDKTEYDFGTFSEDAPVQKCVFTFTNVGDKPLVINQAAASCGCTIPTYTKTPIKPGKRELSKSPIMVRLNSLVISKKRSLFVPMEYLKLLVFMLKVQ